MLMLLLLTELCRPGDAFYIRFFRETDLSDTFVVDRDTTVFLPMIGPVSLAGLEKHQAVEKLEKTVGSLYSKPLVKVEPMIRVSVMGRVQKPGEYYLLQSDGFVQLLALAGTRDRADIARARVIRQGRAIGLDLRRPDPGLLPQNGDVLVIPGAWWPSLTDIYYAIGTAALAVSLYSLAGR